MSIYKELSTNNEIEKIKGIRFGILSPEEIRRLSVAEIYKTDTYVSTEPVVNGLFDPRMGVLDHNKICQTCEQKNTFCPGHFGHINLAKPVFYIQFFDIIKKLLKCVCFRCSKLLINPDSDQVKAILNKKYSRQKRWEQLYKLCSKMKRCGQDTMDGCGAKQPDKIYREPIVKIIMEWKDLAEESKKQVINAEEVYRILKRISDRDAETMGFSKKFNRPEWMICTVLPVPPPAVRPSVRTDTGQRSEDDLTHKLCDIVKSNNSLKLKIEKGASKEQIDIATQVLQYHIATFIDNKIPGINPAQQRTGRLLKSLTERLKSKDGRIRGNLMGKRVDFSARSVITPDPNISIDELGVPMKIAMNLTFPEICNKYNKEKLMQYVINGPEKYPGAKFIRKNNWTKSLKNIPDRTSIVLEEGDVVDRHMIDGDFVLFNRQPSLHKYSMLCHRVKVMPFHTFRLNVCTCALYNADFDGDEMNLHMPQTITTANELAELAAVPSQIISARECKPIVAIVQDVALGVYRITKSSVMISQKQLYNLMASNIKFTGSVPKPVYDKNNVQKWSGRQLMSSIIPKNINVRSPNKSYEEKENDDDKENYVIIENGELKQGIVDKTIYQNRTKGLIHSIYSECSPHETRIFFDNTQKLICDWLVQSGFSVGISDLIIDSETTSKLGTMIHNMKVKVYDMIRDIHIGKFENKSISNNSEFFETEVNKILNQTISEVGKMALSKLDDLQNRMINMVKSGSKGSIINVSQMIACLGQQNVDGKRIAYGFDDRTLPHYTKYDDGPESRGFVENSFITGLSPQEFFFHSMGGREGLIDTAVKSVTGDTLILIIENGISKYVKIGDWIDSHIDGNREGEVKHYPEDRNMEFLELNNKVFIPTCDEKGNTSWGELTAVTRHDPGERLYEVTTLGGRKVIAAESKTLLIWDSNKKIFEAKNSKEIKIGDFVPVTASLPEPPVIINYVDMTQYFPKTEYLYGTEFNTAVKMMKEAQGDNFRIPLGWWEKHNGTSFITPYPSKARLQRVTVRSNIENIKDNCVYPFAADRECACIPDKFHLNYENGVFIGIYLADGNTDSPSGTIQITKKDESVQEFVRQYFDKMKITHRTVTQQNKKGITYGVIGSSTLLERFLDKFVGIGARNKYVPDVAFSAPLDFVKGILSGYFSGDGSIDETSISVSSASSRLIEGISQLCTRIDVFGKVTIRKQTTTNLDMDINDIAPSHTLSIRSHWGTKFTNSVNLIMKEKQDKLKNTKFTDSHINFNYENDVVLDSIIDINVIGVDKYPKLYDVTVPSTLNFTLGNGLNCLDTSETGYLQRKLVKAMEDCKINYDYTVRNASGSIIQFLYGEDGMDATKIEAQPILYIESDYAKIRKDYLLSKTDKLEGILDKTTLKELNTVKDWDIQLEKHFKQIIEDREFIIKKIFDDKKETSIMYPVSFMRIINNAKALYNKYEKGVYLDINPLYILETIEKMGDELYINKNNLGNKFMKILIRCYLSPKKVIYDYRFSKLAFDNIIQQVKLKFWDAIAHPSEMVGVIAAQSIGEPCTQMSNSKDTIVRVMGKNNFAYSGPVGNFIDKLLEKSKNKVIDLGNDSVVMDLDEEYNIIGVSDKENTSWKRISQISRHPANGGLVKVYTRSGKTTTATLTHSFLKRTETGIESIKGSDLKVGLRIPVAKYIAEIENSIKSYTIGDYGDVMLDNDFGWLCGVYIADGNVNSNNVKITKCIPEYYNNLIRIVKSKFNKDITQRFTERSNFKDYPDRKYKGVENNFNCKDLANFFGDNFGRGSENKKVPAWVYGANKEFISGVIGGYFDGDGNVNCDEGKQMIRCGSISENLINDIIVLLAYFGIFGSKCLEFSKTGKVKKSFHTIQVSKKYARLFNDNIGFIVEEKAINLHEVLNYVENNNRCDTKEYIDKIPELGKLISNIGSTLQLPGHSRIFGRWEKKDSIGRDTLKNYINIFEEANTKNNKEITNKIELLKQAAYSDVVWDEIVQLEYLDDPKEFVYDFTVPGNDSFMVDTCILVHNTLNTFHLSGVSSASKAVRGVPRIKELLSVTKNMKAPSMTICIDKEFNKDKMKCKDILNMVETTYVKDIIKNTKIYYDPNDFDTTIEEDKLFLETYKEFTSDEDFENLSPWLLRMEFDKERMLERKISMIDIFHVLHEKYDGTVNAMFSDDNAMKLVFRIKIFINDKEQDIITELKALEKIILENVIIKGIHKINKVSMNKKEFFKYNDELMTFDKTHEWVLETNGTNLLEILAHKYIDNTRTISNNINEIYELFGIEAARQALYNEMWEVIKDADLYVNYRHLSLLVDTMTNKGYLLSIDRHGINRVDIGPLAKSSFEETTDMIIKAGIFAEVDKINGVSANIMLGQIPPCGTGDTEVLIDELKLIQKEEDIEELEEEPQIDNSICYNLGFEFSLPDKDTTVTKKDFNVTIV